jgi:transcriptional activator of cad operon
MEASTATKLRIGAWCVDPMLGQIARDGQTLRLEPRTMRLLQCLAARAGATVSADELLEQAWPGVVVTSDSVYQAIASLRRLLGDDPKNPSYIVTVPRLGYRMVAPVGPWAEPLEPVTAPPAALNIASARPANWLGSRRRRAIAVLAGAVMMAISVSVLLRDKAGSTLLAPANASTAYSTKTIAVLPFLDLTEQMGEEYFADGITEELIGRFSKVPGFRVPAPAAVFHFKGKPIPVADIARQLAVEYVVDGSVRKSGSMVRVAARLMRADNGFIIWSETYDRPFDDLLMVQDDIASEVTKALKNAIRH